MVLLGKVCCLKLESSVLHLHVIYVEGDGLEGGVSVVVIYKSDSYMSIVYKRGVSVVDVRVIYKSYSYMSIIYKRGVSVVDRGVSVVIGGRVIYIRGVLFIRLIYKRGVSVVVGDLLQIVETEKLRNYDLLVNELGLIYKCNLGLIYKCNVEIIPYVITWDGIVTKYYNMYLKIL
ncbi:hypothetical protein CWI38_1132p0020 [Hamiltosporidium tvaerminnensis]|uniref:Uncharacterized protein n=1 Tax=Hamiltosporidium tvaerminnensis TaxID=1176355 RepID=A0A4Q9LSL6_9MICR|nr:hypothetical protein CWI38_1132p0020 [Hamiltosporidium tvaerminnensis]